MITLPAYLYNDFAHVASVPFIRRIEYVCDAVIEVESFAGSPTMTNPLYTSDYTGLIRVLSLFRLHSLSHMSRLSDVELSSMGFKVQRKKFTIETFHLPPEDAEKDKTNARAPSLDF